MKVKLVCAALFVTFSGIIFGDAWSQQININRVEAMPNMPSPYQMRDWQKVTLGYDSFVFDFNLNGQFLPLIWWRTNTVNYPNHISFGLHTVVGTTVPGSAEAINVLPAVISASLAGIDKSNQNGQNWVLMCEEYFNKANGANVYLNHPSGSGWDDWWYDTMPNVFFYQLYDLYPNTGDFTFQFGSVADHWLAAVEAMGGSATPWHVPNMNYRAFNLMTMTPFSGGVKEPEAAGAIAWLLYCAFKETGNPDYRVGAEWAMEFLNSRSTNPSYELQLPYGVLAAARMNAELHTGYDIEKLLNWCFTTSGNVRNWGAIVGNWGGYDCSGLIGEVSSNDYAFLMNTFEQAGALVPLVRYDEPFARAIGKWMVNAANAARLLYPDFLPDENQDSETWAHQYDPQSYIAHEALHEFDPNHSNISPFATGDAVIGGWGQTNLALYGSSHLGIFGGIIDTTNIPGILRLDVLKTDYFHDDALPTYLYFNPDTNQTQQVSIDLGSGQFDLYDAAENQFLAMNVSGTTNIGIPPDEAVLLVIIPSGGNITYELDRMLVDGIVADYHSGQPVANYPPRIKSLKPDSSVIVIGGQVTAYCTATDPDGDSLSHAWEADGGAVSGNGKNANWTMPNSPGQYQIFCIVNDNAGAADTAMTAIEAVEFINHAPSITAVKADPRKLDLGATASLLCQASDPDGDSLTFSWSANSGMISDSGQTAAWQAPAVAGNYYVACLVQDGHGGEAIDSIGIEVRDFSNFKTRRLQAYYPFAGNANDASGNGHNGTVHGAALTDDRFGNANSAYYFDGVNDYIRIPNHDSLNFRQGITINFWMKVNQLYNREAYVLSHGSYENRWKISIIPEGKLRWTIKTNSTGSNGIKDLDTETILVEGAWYNVTVFYDGADFEIYLDGSLDSFSDWSGLLLTTNIDPTIAQMLPNNSSYNFNGVLDEIQIFDYGLSPTKIRQLYEGLNSIEDGFANQLPVTYNLEQNFPNPFNPATAIRFSIPRRSEVTLKIYDVQGREVATLAKKQLPAGDYQFTWDAADFASGIYFYRLDARPVGIHTGRDFTQTKKLILLK